MITTGQSITNSVTGETLVFRTTSADTNGERVVVETFVEPNGAVAAAHVHPGQEERFEVLAGELEFPWLRSRIAILPAESHWQTLAKAALRDDLSGMLRALTSDALRAGDVPAWKARNAALHERFRQILGELRAAESPDLAMLSVALRELRNLSSR